MDDLKTTVSTVMQGVLCILPECRHLVFDVNFCCRFVVSWETSVTAADETVYSSEFSQLLFSKDLQ